MQLFGKPLELLILDVDGVLVDLASNFEQNLAAVAGELGLSVEPIRNYLAAMRQGDRVGKSNLHEGIMEFWPSLTEAQVSEYVTRFRTLEREKPYPVFPDSIDTACWFKGRGVPIALCTTNDRATLANKFAIANIELSWFAAMSTWEDGFPKPDPRSFDSIFRAVPVPREHTVYVGDWYPDLEVARGAGVRFIAVLTGGIPREAFIREGVPPDHIIERLSDLPKLTT